MFVQLRKTVKNTIIYSMGNMAGKLSGVILLPLYTKFLPIEEYGLLALLEITYQLIHVISGFGIKGALIRYYWDKDLAGMEKVLFYTSYVFNLLISFITIIVFFFVITNFSEIIFGIELSKEIIIIFLSSTLLRLIVDTPMLLLRIQQKAFKQTAVQLTILVLTVGLTVYYIAFRGSGIEGVFLAQMYSSFLALLLLIKHIYQNIQFRFDRAILREFLHFGIPLFLSNLVGIIFILSDRFILNFFGSLDNVGNYTLAFKISNIIQIILVTSFMNAYTHIFYNQMSSDNAGRFYMKSMTYFVFILVFVSVGLILFSKETIKILSMGNQDYWDSINLIPILVAGVIFGGIRQLLILPLSRLKMTRTISFISICSALLNLVLNFILIPLLSSIGAATSTAVTQILTTIWLYRIVRVNDTTDYEVVKIIKLLILGAAYYLVAVLIDDFSLTWRLIIKSILLILFFFILYLWNFFEKIEIEHIKGFWNKWSDLKELKNNISKIKIE